MFEVNYCLTNKSSLIRDEMMTLSEWELNDLMGMLNKNYTKLFTVENNNTIVIGFRKGDVRCDVTISKV